MGKETLDEAPPLNKRPVKDTKTGKMTMVPKGISQGFDYAPGKSWAQGLVPKMEQKPLQPKPNVDVGPQRPRSKVNHNLPDLKDTARPSTARVLEVGEDTVDAFLNVFGASKEQAVLFRDASEHVVVISQDLFKTHEGKFKGDKHGRAPYSLFAAEALKDPDEIWVDWEYMDDAKKAVLRRRYIRYNKDHSGLAVFSYGTKGWDGTTSYALRDGSQSARDDYMEKQRIGKLLWRNPKVK
jgi:hypothetical protein